MSTAVPLKLISLPASDATEPTVLAGSLLNRLRATNRTIRWLREHGHLVRKLDLGGERPTITVECTAEQFLVHYANGFNGQRIDGQAARYVLREGCAIQWYCET